MHEGSHETDSGRLSGTGPWGSSGEATHFSASSGAVRAGLPDPGQRRSLNCPPRMAKHELGEAHPAGERTGKTLEQATGIPNCNPGIF